MCSLSPQEPHLWVINKSHVFSFPLPPPSFHPKTLQHGYTSYLFARVGGNESNTFLNVLLQVSNASLHELLLSSIELADRLDLSNTLRAQNNLGAEEVNALILVERRLNERGLGDALLALDSAENGVSHAGTSHSHGESGGTGTVLGLDDLVTTELNTVDELSVGGQVGVVGLGEERDDGGTRVSTDDGDALILGVGVFDLADEAGSTDNVEGGDTEEELGVVDASSLEDLLADGDGGVDGVGDDEELSLGGVLGNSLGQVANDGGVGVEQIVTGHAGLAGDTSGDEDNLRALQALSERLVAILGRGVALDGGLGVHVGDIGSDT